MGPRAWTSCIALACVAASGSARAASPNEVATADALFREGRALMEARDYARACTRFAASLRLELAVGTILNLAACEEKTGRIGSAWLHYRQVVELLVPEDERHPFAEDAARQLDARVPRLTIVLDGAPPSGLVVTKDDVELGATSFGVALAIDPGPHVVTARVPGRDERKWTFAMREGERRHLKLDVAGGAHAPPRATNRTAGFVVGGLGVVSLAVGTYFGVRALSSRSESDAGCNNGVCRDPASVAAYDDARTFAHVADAAIAIGVVGVAVSAYLLFAHGGAEATAAKNRSRVSFALTPSGVKGTW